MDLSIKNYNTTQKNINFKGLEGAYNKESKPVFKFIAPPHTSDEKVVLEIVPLYKDDRTAKYERPDKEDISEFDFKQDDTIEILQEDVRDISSGFAYRYKISNSKTKETRYAIDSFKSMKINDNGEKMNVIEQGKMYGISPKGGTMRHSFLDSDVRLDNQGNMVTKRNQEFVRNHFNKLGGNMSGLLYLLKNTNELAPYRYIMTTPDIGVDKISSHKYWPSNQYQCSDIDTFKDFNYELFKQGKGYIADGAFTSQGIQSPLVQHVLKWGEESPFYNMLKIDGDLSLGILPDFSTEEGKEAYNHIGVRLVNDKDSDNFNPKQPTYIQFYDDRLLDKESQTDNLPHFDYNKAPLDHYEITNHQDSIQPYAFEIDRNDKRMRVFEENNAVLIKDIDNFQDFISFPNFKITTKNKVAGATYWDGNVDIIKMNLSNPSPTEENRQGVKQAREYLFGVASYWTELVQSDLILKTALEKDSNKKALCKANDISSEQYENIKNSLDDFNSLVLSQNKETEDYVKNFPIQSLETGEDLSAVFSEPQFKKEFLSEENTDKICKIFDNTVNNAIPENYKNNEQYKTYVKKTYGNEILRHIFISAIEPEAINNDATIDSSQLKNTSLRSFFKIQPATARREREGIVSKLSNKINSADTSSLQAKMHSELKNISLNDFKLAEAIVLQGKGGLNWRFDAAKDIGDLDAVRDNNRTFNQIWNGDMLNPGVQAFWGEFVSRIKDSNPSSYIINEVTSLGEFLKGQDLKSKMEFDPQLAQAYEELDDDEKTWENDVVYQKQIQFLDETNSTTTSEYSKGFNSFSNFIGVDPEHGKDKSSSAGKLTKLKNDMESLMEYNQPNSAIFSHMFTNNHDKPSILHTLPLDMPLYLTSDLNTVDDKTKEKIKQLTGGREDYENISAKAVAVGLAMKDVIDDNYTGETQQKLTNGLRKLVNGQKIDESNQSSYKRAESFGVLPYEVTVNDLFEYSDLEYKEDDVLNFHNKLLSNSMVLYERLWQVMNACVGTPALYGGNEFGQTGYETASKNVYLGIRNEVLHSLKDDKRYKPYYDKISHTSELYKTSGLSALRDGSPISLEINTIDSEDTKKLKNSYNELVEDSGMDKGKMEYFNNQILAYLKNHKNLNIDSLFTSIKTKAKTPNEFQKFLQNELDICSDNDNHEYFFNSIDNIKQATKLKERLKDTTSTELWPIYKKNSRGSEVISIISNLGIAQNTPSNKMSPKAINFTVPSINLEDKNGECPFKNGTILNKVNSHGQKTNDEKYIVVDNSIQRVDKKPIKLDDTVTTFFIDKTI